MNDDHSSDRADELIARAARDYNEPGDVPREEIWNRIAESRRAARLPSASSTRRVRVWAWPTVGVAAAGLVAVGVAIGRGVERSQVRDQHAPPAPLVSRDSTAPASPASGGASSPIASPLNSDVSGFQASVADTLRATPTPAGDTSPGAIAYRLAVLQHVAGSEAMITEFRASARRGDVDAQLAKWSRDLLGETRMLESSAPPGDVTMKRLLQDLDLVLAQIVQYANHDTHATDDLDLIERSIKRRAVMSNLRTLSAGRLPSGT
jgi:hypothetical protein